MNEADNLDNSSEVIDDRQICLRVLALGVASALIAEIMFTIVQGVILFPGKPVMNMLVWGAFCAIGMGSAVGAAIIMGVVGRYEGIKAILISTVLGSMVFIFCGFLCYELSLIFNYYGARELQEIFIIKNAILSVSGSALLSWLVFSAKGSRFLTRLGI
mgnify:CR=1 FL=1